MDRRRAQLGLQQLSATNLVTGRRLMVVLKSYYDGGNQADSLQYKILTLGGLAGNDKGWPLFESSWKRVLERHHADFLHTTDAVALQKYFSKSKGWSRDRVNRLIEGCAGVLEHCIDWGIRPMTVSIILEDYKKVLARIPDLLPVEYIAATHSVSLSILYGIVEFGQDLQCEFRSEEHTSELQSLRHLVCRLLLEKK